ncbi:MAG: multiheme c-type cytochrome, partial [Caldimonas sp.]
HASAKRQNQYTWHAISATEGFWEVTYPGILNDCQTCHLPNTFDLSATNSQAASGQVDGIDKRPYRTVAAGNIAAGFTTSPFVTPGSYGSAFSENKATGATTEAAGTTLVTSPTVTVCSACHDSADAISHFKINGAAFYMTRNSAITLGQSNETCLVCHGTGRIADIAVMHAKNR